MLSPRPDMAFNRLAFVRGEQRHVSFSAGERVAEAASAYRMTSLVLYLQDDIIDDVESFVAAAETLKERGAYKIYVMATHGILSAEAPRLIEESPIDEVCLLRA